MMERLFNEAGAGFRARHDLGQNFLQDTRILNRITDTALELLPSEGVSAEQAVCIEIGPGTGQLTEALLRAGFAVSSLEIDERLKPVLDERLAECEGFRLVMGDAQNVDLNAIAREAEPAVILGISNLPYYVTTPLIIKYLTDLPEAAGFVFMVQADVLTRLRASRNKSESIKRRGVVQILGEAYGSIDVVQNVPASAFLPAPRVGSVLLAYRPAVKPVRGREFYVEHPSEFVAFLSAAFTQRRRTLSNNLKADLENRLGIDRSTATVIVGEILEEWPESAGMRAEQLTTEEHLRLARRWHSCLTK